MSEASEARRYAEGGYVGERVEPVPTFIHPAECIIAWRDHELVCIRYHEHGGRK